MMDSGVHQIISRMSKHHQAVTSLSPSQVEQYVAHIEVILDDIYTNLACTREEVRGLEKVLDRLFEGKDAMELPPFRRDDR